MAHMNMNTHKNTGNYSYPSNRRNAVRMQRRMTVVFCLIICIVCLIIGFFQIKNLLSDKEKTIDPTSSSSIPDTSIPISSSDTTDTQASQETTTSSQAVTADERAAMLAQLNTDISALIESESGRYSVYYINMNNNETLAINEQDPMVAASSIKIAFNTYLYQQVAAGACAMTDTMNYNAAAYPDGDYEAGTGTIQNSADQTEYTLQQISNLSITISDNCATNMLLRKLGGSDSVNENYLVPISSIVNYRSSVSYTDYTGATSSGKNRTCAEDLALYAKNLYLLYTESPDAYQGLITDLCNTEYDWGVPSGVPDEYEVAHKVGFNPSYGSNNDVGIVFAQEDYVLCVMTESADGANAQAVIGQISSLIYNYVSGCYS